MRYSTSPLLHNIPCYCYNTHHMMHQLDTKTPSRYYLIIALYVLLVGVMLYLQYGSAIPFHDTYKGLEIQGRKRAGAGGSGLSEIRVEYGEFSVAFSDTKPLVFHRENGSQTESDSFQVSSYAKFPDRLEVRFGSDIIMYFTQETDSGSIECTLETSEPLPSVIEIPFFLRHPEELIVSEGFPVIQHPSKSSKEGYFVRLSPGSVIDSGAGCLRIEPETDTALINIETSEADSIISYWFSKQPASVSESEYKRGIRDYLQKSYYGWKSGRYNSFTATWKANSGTIFTEELIDAFGAEAFRVNDGDSFADRIVPAASEKPELTYLANPFLGNIMNTSPSLANDAAKALELAHSGPVSTIKNAVLLLRFAPLLTQARRDQLSERLLSGIAEQNDPSALAVQVYLYFHLFGSENPAVFRKIEETLLPKLTPYKDGYIFESLESVSDTFFGILAGSVLAEQNQKPMYGMIGKSVILTYLSMADSTGRIPREFLQSGSVWTAGTEFMLPEEIYMIIAPGTYYPKVFSLESGMWAWTNAAEVTSVARGNQIHITSEFPVNGVYHLTITDVEPFAGIRLYGIPWKSDPQFQRYSSGWAYSLDTKTLYIKLKQRRPSETIVIDYSASPEEVIPAGTDSPVTGLNIAQ